MKPDTSFWYEMGQLIYTNSIIIDRPKGNPHPRYSKPIYPLDYCYLENTSAGDGGDIDVWLGSLKSKTLTGILLNFDKIERDAEIKFLAGFTPHDVQVIRQFLDRMIAFFIPNPTVNA